MPVPDDSGATKGWRFLGGGIEFGERAEDALARELREEIGAAAIVGRQIAIVENIYEHHGIRGHEIVFVHEAEIVDSVLLARETIPVLDDEVTPVAHWIAFAAFANGREKLLPAGLLAHLK